MKIGTEGHNAACTNDCMTVSICIVARNEAKTLPRLLDDICEQDYPAELIEVVLVDGRSEDRTKRVMKRFAESNHQFRRVCICDNPKRILAPGWNIAIESSTGDIIVRVDAHARIPRDFISANVAIHEEGEMITGGPRPNAPEEDTPWQNTLLLAEESLFGSGIAGFRRTTEGRKYVKSLFHGAYRREVFEVCGGLNEELGRTEDNELNWRIREHGYRLCYDPSIQSFQYTRSSLPRMMKQKYSNGYWVALTTKVCPQCLSLYHFVPFAFVVAIIAAVVLDLFGWGFWLTLLFGAYLLADIVMTATAIMNTQKRSAQNLALLLLFPALHISYGVGSLVGFVKWPFWKPKSAEENNGQTEAEDRPAGERDSKSTPSRQTPKA